MPRAIRPGPLAHAPALAIAIGLSVFPLPTWADAQDTVNYRVGLTHQRDDNLFRLPAGINPLPLVGKSARADSVTSAMLGVNFSKAYSLQQIEADFEHFSHRYGTYGFLNHGANNARAAWRWQLTPWLKGNLTANRNQALVGFADYRAYNKLNLRTTASYRLDADWNIFHNGWHLRGGLDHTRTSNSQTFTQDEGTRIASADIGLRYVFPSSNWIDVIVRGGSGSYLGRDLDLAHRLDNGFSDRRADLRAFWQNGKSQVEGGLGYLARDYDHFADRDFTGGVGNLKWTWKPTGKIAVIVAWKRDLAAYTDTASSYYIQNTYSVSPVWQVDSKIRLSLRLDRNNRDFRGPVSLLPVVARHEQINTAQLVAEWTPQRAITVSGYLTEDWRNSNQAGYDYDARVAGANVRLDF